MLALVIAFLLIVAALVVSAIFLAVSYSNRMKKKKESLLLQQSLYAEHSKMMDSMFQTMEKCRKDISELMPENTANLRLELEHYDVGRKYIPWNGVLNTMFFSKEAECQQEKIDLEMNLDFDTIGKIPEMDILGIFFNVFDNAIEACKRIDDTSKRFIRLECYVARRDLVIKCMNSKSKNMILSTGRRTWKNDTELHGLGTEILKELTERNYGELILQEKEDEFLTRIKLPIRG